MTLNSNTRLAMEVIEQDMENVGFRWPVESAAFVVYDNIGSATTLDQGSTTVCTLGQSGCGASGSIVSGTDVVELFSGDPNRRQGYVVNAANGGSTVTVTFLFDMGLTAADVNGLLMFLNIDNTYCVGQITSVTPGAVASATIVAPPASIPAFPGQANFSTCVESRASTYILGSRKRYMIYQTPSGSVSNGASFGLYAATAGETGVLGVPQLVQDGVEDLQLEWLLSNAPTASNPLGCPLTAGVAPNVCFCNTPTSACDASNGNNPASAHTGLIRAVRVMLTSRGNDQTQWDLVATSLGGFRPVAYNHAAGTSDIPGNNPPMGYSRVQLESAYFFWNFGTTWLGQ